MDKTASGGNNMKNFYEANETKETIKNMTNLIMKKLTNIDFNYTDLTEQSSIQLDSLRKFLEREGFNFSLNMTDDGQIIYCDIYLPIPDKYSELFKKGNLDNE